MGQGHTVVNSSAKEGWLLADSGHAGSWYGRSIDTISLMNDDRIILCGEVVLPSLLRVQYSARLAACTACRRRLALHESMSNDLLPSFSQISAITPPYQMGWMKFGVFK